MSQTYAKHLTRDYLEYLGITEVSEDGTKIMKGDKELSQHFDGRYLLITLYDPAIRQACPTELRTNRTGQIHFGVHRIVYCWYNRIIPEGMVIDHVNNNKTDNRLKNLQPLTPKANINKERVESIKQTKCKMNKPRSFYENKLKHYEELYEYAKLNKDPVACHKLRSNIAQTRARLRYWDAHKDEYKDYIEDMEGAIKMKKELTEFKKDLMELASWKKFFKDNGNKKLWHECCTIEKLVKVKGVEAEPIVKHALEVCHKHFGGN